MARKKKDAETTDWERQREVMEVHEQNQAAGNGMQEVATAPAADLDTQMILPFTTTTSLDFPADGDFELWARYMRILRLTDGGIQWWIGDMMLAARKRGKDWEEHAIQTAHELGYKDATLAQMLSVCEAIAKDRRRDDLDFGHHKAVAYMKSKKKADEILALAANDVTGKWSVRMVEDAVREAEAKPARGVTHTNGAAPEPKAAPRSEKKKAAEPEPREPDAVASATAAFPVTEEDFNAELVPMARYTQEALNEAIAYLEQPTREKIAELNEKCSVARDFLIQVMELLESYGAEAL